MLRRYSVRLLLMVIAVLALAWTCSAASDVVIRVGFAPPALPVYEQPPCPGDDYIWTPGYWAWDGDYDDYFWVPGTWVLAPEAGYFWTPPYWGWADGAYVFYPGYWGPQVGFYGGIVYGFGYYGHGYDGGRWDNGHFYYNRYVNNVNVNVVHNVYETRVENRNVNEVRVSYNGGNGGVSARPTSQEETVARERRVGPTSVQTQHIQAARGDTQLRAADNHGKPPVAATPRPNDFRGQNVVPARAGGNYTPPPNHGNAGRPAPNAPANNENNRVNPGNNRPAVHPNDLPPRERPTAPNSGNTKQDQEYQQQQEKLYQQQQQERQRLQQQQEKEHQKMQQQENQAKQNQQHQQEMQQRQQQMEQRHQQQTQQMNERHQQQQQQQQQQRQAPPSEKQAPPPAHENPPPQQPQPPHH